MGQVQAPGRGGVMFLMLTEALQPPSQFPCIPGQITRRRNIIIEKRQRAEQGELSPEPVHHCQMVIDRSSMACGRVIFIGKGRGKGKGVLLLPASVKSRQENILEVQDTVYPVFSSRTKRFRTFQDNFLIFREEIENKEHLAAKWHTKVLQRLATDYCSVCTVIIPSCRGNTGAGSKFQGVTNCRKAVHVLQSS